MSILTSHFVEETRARLNGLEQQHWRRILMFGVPFVIILVAGSIYLLTGRYVSTDNAYVKANMVSVSPEVSGRITQVMVQENQHVEAGTPLLQMEKTPYQIAVTEAEARLAEAAAGISSLKAQYEMGVSQRELAKSSAEYYQHEYDRQVKLARKDYASQAKLDQARFYRDTTKQMANVLEQSINQTSAKLNGKPSGDLMDYSAYRTAKAALDNARLQLNRTTVRAPFAGILGHQPQVGDVVGAGTPLVSLISDQNVWVEGNFKETQLTDVHVGQKVSVTIDTYPDHEWEGVVESIAQGTGSEFSVLPAQNATGNWVKVVQRIPVHIALVRHQNDPEIRAGMSCDVKIDTKSIVSGTTS